ncbi:hypothetical protein KFL_002210110 [Klebsormidium nitens]|uniref:Cytochrome b561 domain-containing protein n=1 Tax=Klebsormidium nitens TaxID=105231 RepID=A0A1Y1I8X9_KLENI|nr:hypothetical protein KFL_002210110 [Klebsormidium nitens]|eukprot:GAQ85146.1 hypothetical protein KFL_002210110 [Klebsormidium nitens]
MESSTQVLALAFLILPAGIASASLLKNRVQYWLAIHIALQVAGWVLCTVGVALSYQKYGAVSTAEATLLGLVWANPLIAAVRPPKGSKMFPAWYKGHWAVGLIAVAAGWAYLASGLNQFKGLSNMAAPAIAAF